MTKKTLQVWEWTESNSDCSSCVNACTSCNSHCSDDVATTLQPVMRTHTVAVSKWKKGVELSDEQIQEVLAYENPLYIQRMIVNWANEKDAINWFQELKKFLIVCAVSDKPISPSHAMDELWHDFILFTKDYSDFCIGYFGKMIHHYPEVNTTPEQRISANNRFNESKAEAIRIMKGDIDIQLW